jgi:hypothetical protein
LKPAVRPLLLPLAALLLAALTLATCTSPVDPDLGPDAGLFSCAMVGDAEAECGSGWVCQPRFEGGGRCYPAGFCERFDLSSDSANCGSCGHACGPGTSCADAGCVESACGDALDNDGNGQADCADLACAGQRCDADAGHCGVFITDGGVDGGVDGGSVRGCF